MLLSHLLALIINHELVQIYPHPSNQLCLIPTTVRYQTHQNLYLCLLILPQFVVIHHKVTEIELLVRVKRYQRGSLPVLVLGLAEGSEGAGGGGAFYLHQETAFELYWDLGFDQAQGEEDVIDLEPWGFGLFQYGHRVVIRIFYMSNYKLYQFYLLFKFYHTFIIPFIHLLEIFAKVYAILIENEQVIDSNFITYFNEFISSSLIIIHLFTHSLPHQVAPSIQQPPMQLPNSKIDSQSRAQPRKFQYFTGDSTNNNLTASSIDQHRNSIEQRIANLESKLAKKFNPELELSTLAQPQSENYVNTRRMYQYSGVNNQNKNYTPSNPQLATQNAYNPQNSSSAFSNTRQVANSKGNAFNYLSNFDKTIDQIALRQKSKFSWQINTNLDVANDKIQSKDKLKAALDKGSTDKVTSYSTQKNPISNQSKERVVGKKIKNLIDPKGQNFRQQDQHKYQSSQKFSQKYPLSHYQPEHAPINPNKTTATLPCSNPILNGRYFQEFNQLNTNISNLKSTVDGQYPFENYQNPNTIQSRTISYDTGVNLREPQKNNELYDMMKSIMMGQERLEKELLMLKSSKMQKDKVVGSEIYARNSQGIKPFKQNDRDKFFTNGVNKKNYVPDSRLMSPHNIRQEQTFQVNQSRSPHTNNRKSVSPQTHKSKSPAQNKSSNPTPLTSAIKCKRANSAVMGKKLPGKIQKNKQRFDELYKQAQLNKRLSQSQSRITVSSEVVSSVWEKIKQSIKRAESDDAETAVIYHENNRWVNDHLVSKIELQKKLKNDLVKKVYEMVENKCLFK